MGKYFIIAGIGIVLLFCGFNICEKKVWTNGKIARVYIYPDCDDTGTYLKQRYNANHIVEYLYIHSRLRYKRILDKAGVWVVNEYTYSKKNDEVYRIDSFPDMIPDKSFDINDSCSLNIEYFADGGYHICTYGFNRNQECRHQQICASTIVFDTVYKSKRMGSLQIICDSNAVTDAFTNDEFVKIVHRERQTGMWYTVRDDGMRMDSIFYRLEQ